MLYGRYKDVRNAAWSALIDLEITELPVSVEVVAKRLNIKLIKNEDLRKSLLSPGIRGLTILSKGKWYIIYSEKESVPVRRFTIAHEIGHILLGHLLTNKAKYRTFAKRNPQEQEADVFAARLLAPACVLWALDLHTPEDIAAICNISLSAARHRAERMELLYKRNMFLTSPLERYVYKQFLPYLNRNHSQSGNFESDK